MERIPFEADPHQPANPISQTKEPEAIAARPSPSASALAEPRGEPPDRVPGIRAVRRSAAKQAAPPASRWPVFAGLAVVSAICLGVLGYLWYPQFATHYHLRVGQTCIDNRDFVGAQASFEQALTLDAGNARARSGLE